MRPVNATSKFAQFARLQIGLIQRDQRFGSRIHLKVGHIALLINVRQIHLHSSEAVAKRWFRKTAFEWNPHRLVIFVAVAIKHHDNFAQMW